ncbi:hybrid sensor histidine kinase/response regulator [Pseudosulfitobacter koreensis]|uniref:histidine kinase n=1 Tax=Pseudosulfitobacter koreensis TaxID=2968472 RepID=A0ABT1YXG6_9RHOB|nr:PAS domain-containing protein [Pseudosulfitobacter koreense]MCR8825583.1 PAS domain-containing protein [Pseudosulfitobacter koreense]
MQFDLDALFGSAPSPYVLVDPDLRMIWANDAYLEVTGRTRETLIGRIMTEEFPAPPDSISDQMLRGSFRRVLATGRTDHLPLIPYPIEAPDGRIEERQWSATHTPILGDEGKVVYILQNTMDVTDLYRSEATTTPSSVPRRAALLQRAEAIATENLALGAMTEFFQSAFDQAPSFMAILDGPEHVFRITNQAYIDLIGGRDLIGMPVREALPDLAGQGFYELLDQVLETGEPLSFKGMPALIQASSDAEPVEHFIDFIYHPLRDAANKTTGVFVQGHDVTGQKIAEATLTATRERFRIMAQTMPNHVWTADKDGGLNWLNDRTYDYTGHVEGELYGTDWGRAVHPDDLELAAEKWQKSVAQGETYEHEFRIRRADGSYRWHLVRASALRSDEGVNTGWVGTNTDIEERKSAEREIAELNDTLEMRVAKRNQELEELHVTLRQSQKMEAIGNLAGGIAHDFNNLLQVITGNLQLVARETPDASPAKARIEQAMGSVARGATLASQLLSFARKQPLAPKVINLSRFLGNTTDILRSAIGESVALETSFAEDLWNTSVDPSNMENVVLNLAINARDAMEGRGTLKIHATNTTISASSGWALPDMQPGDYVRLEVTDTGSGIAPDIRDHIFEPFFTTKKDGQGTGLGLSMVYGFAKQSGGHVTLDSEVGAGTTIKIYLPRSHEQEHDLQPAQPAGLMGGAETILLVEDDAEVRATAHDLLIDLGYTVLEAANADEALEIVKADQAFDLLFTDVMMAGHTTARDLAQVVQRTRPGVPVLFTSGYVQDAIVHEGRLEAGVQLLGKPYTQSVLAQKLREVLGTAGIPQQHHAGHGGGHADAASDAAPVDTNAPILICEDDILILTDLADTLRLAGYQVQEAGSAAKAIKILQSTAVSLLITDVGLPDLSGEDLAREARQMNPRLPVIFATGDTDVPAASALGNCKVLGKPFQDSKLLEYVRTMLPQYAGVQPD